MSDQFICISCWKEFVADDEELRRRSGKLVCPSCGYIQPAPSDDGISGQAAGAQPVTKLEDPAHDLTGLAEEVPWSSIGPKDQEDDDIPIGEEELTDRVEISPGLLSRVNSDPFSRELGFADEEADEPTPLEPIGPLNSDQFLFGSKEPSNAVLMREAEDEPTLAAPTDWQLKTPSGLTFKFTDPEALLGWKKKLATYKQLHVSPDGERWVDFARFVREFEELGDPLKAFILSESLSDADLPPPKPMPSEDDPEPVDEEAHPESKGKEDSRSRNTATQFTFKVKEEKETGWGKYLLFALLGLGIGAAIVVGVLYLSGSLPI